MKYLVFIILYILLSFNLAFSQSSRLTFGGLHSDGCTLTITISENIGFESYSIQSYWKTSYDTYGGHSPSSGYVRNENDSLYFTEMFGVSGADSIYDSFYMLLIDENTIFVPDTIYCFPGGDTLRNVNKK